MINILLVFFQTCLSISAILLTKYDNSQFISNTNSYFLINFQVFSQYECICRCYAAPNCLTLTFFGINGTCSLYSSQIQLGSLRLTTYTANSAVISFPDRISSKLCVFYKRQIFIFLFSNNTNNFHIDFNR